MREDQGGAGPAIGARPRDWRAGPGGQLHPEGLGAYFRIGNSARHLRQVDSYVTYRFAKWDQRKRQRPNVGWKGARIPRLLEGRPTVPPEWDHPLSQGRCMRPDEATTASRKRENLTYGSNGGWLETEALLHGDGLSPRVGNVRNRQPGLRRPAPPRQPPTQSSCPAHAVLLPSR